MNSAKSLNEDSLIIVFDGVCPLCNGAIDFIMQRDRHNHCLFVPMQSPLGEHLIAPFKADGVGRDTFLLLKQSQIYYRTDAILQILPALTGPWRYLTVLRWLPRAFRDAVYGVIARNRYRFFGQRQQCRMPTPAERGKIIDQLDELDQRYLNERPR
ncbi:MAG: DUF393 domain-containing protein [Gammaproteobacteria bacterium]|nr:DUF393 domain-containing protein [Gammaproteobacteria bacterium]NVK88308.1 DUF393 domain-containing protein [Gammaproteobacteria bacterium]